MRMVFGLVLLAGVALAGGAVYLAKNHIGQYQQALNQARQNQKEVIPTVPVYVATRTLNYGEELKPEDVRVVNWPQDAIPAGTFSTQEILFPTDEDEPRLVVRAMEKDEAILTVKVTEPGEDIGLTSRLERGMRAFAIRVDVASGVSGFLRPGDRVDVYWTGRINVSGERQSDDVTKLIEANVRLIAVDQNSVQSDEARIARTVTVAVRPEQVAALAQAQSTGSLMLSLVGTGDDTVAEGIEIDQMALLGLQPDLQPAPVQQERVCTIRTRRGAEVMQIPIPCTN